MRFIVALWRFFFGRRRSPEASQQPATQLVSASQPLLSSTARNTPGLGQMDHQIAAMVQMPLSARSIKAQFSAIAEDGFTGVMSESDQITPDGIRAEKIHHLIITGSGHVTKANGIKVKCQFCGQFDSVIHRCSVPTCRLPLCELHAIYMELYGQRVCYCPNHAVSAENNRDNWKEYWLAQERRKDASDST